MWSLYRRYCSRRGLSVSEQSVSHVLPFASSFISPPLAAGAATISACSPSTCARLYAWRHLDRWTMGLVDVVLDEQRLLNRRLRARHVLADGGLGVGLGARQELVLSLLVVLLLA